MDICTINDLREALTAPEQHFCTLDNVRAELTTLSRTTHFAECVVTSHDHKMMLYVPITPRAMELALGANRALYATRGSRLRRMIILRAEMICRSKSERRCSVIVEDITELTPFRDALNGNNSLSLRDGIRELGTQLSFYNISHNNLTINNLMVDRNGIVHPIRQYYTTTGIGGDSESLKQILADVESLLPRGCVCEDMSCYRVERDRRERLNENRQMFRTARGIGYKDERGEVVIPDIYSWATDFYEGRAIVANNHNKFGVIDRNGNEIVPTIYDHIEFNRTTCGFKAYRDNLMAEFSYSAEQITPWEEI